MLAMYGMSMKTKYVFSCPFLVINTKVVSQAKGSAYVEFDATKVMVGV